jgi:acetyltransferase-like isoleucine patch superfamily enzyme
MTWAEAGVRPAGLATLGSGSYVTEPYLIRAPHRVHIGEGVSIGERSVLSVVDEYHGASYGGVLRIGDGCAIGSSFYVHCAREVVIGEGVRIGARVFVADSARDLAQDAPSVYELDIGATDPVCIDDGAALGTGAMVLAGVTIGEGAMVAAGAVVTRNVAAGATVAGNPARTVRR